MRRILYFIGIAGLLASCSSLKQIDTSYSRANTNYKKQSYQLAYADYSEVIKAYDKENKNIPNSLYLKTAESAEKIGNISAAQEMYEKALKDSVSLTAIKAYANLLKQKQDYKSQVELLKANSDFIKNNGETSYFNSEIFDVAIALNDKVQILDNYKKVASLNENQALVVTRILSDTNSQKALTFVNDIIRNNPTFYKVKEWKGIYYYNKAEKRYKSEMDKYNKHKTYTAYIYLKRDLKKISADYRISKNIFEELHKVYPQELRYVKYLKNILLRLDLKKEAESMDELLK